jgi:uncharacterized protein (DUF2062 family)
MADRLTTRIKTALLRLLRDGMSPSKIALCVAAGGILGLFPVPGVTTLLCAAVAWGLRLNHAAIQAVNYAAYPLQLLLIGPFFALGSRWLGDGGLTDAAALFSQPGSDLPTAVMAAAPYLLGAIAVWAAAGLPAAVLVFIVTRSAARTVTNAVESDGRCRQRPAARWFGRTGQAEPLCSP